jgi:hypothetical protein
LSHTSEMSAANRGAEKLMAIAPASGMKKSAMTVKVCETACDSPRATCAPGRPNRPKIGAEATRGL